jgi:diacylglycerol kinase
VLRNLFKVDSASVARATFTAAKQRQQALEIAAQLQADVRQQKRLQAALCVTCFYLRANRIAGAAVTQQPCGICEALQTYASTTTDILCLECAKSHQLCKHCGADAELKLDRQYVP